MRGPGTKNPNPMDGLDRLADELSVWRDEGHNEQERADDLILASYVAGGLEDDARQRLEERLARSPELREIVRVVREAVGQSASSSHPEAVRLNLRPPVLPAPAPPGEERAARHVFPGLRWWLAAAVAAAGVLLAMAVLHRSSPNAPSPSAASMGVHRCTLDGNARIIRRDPLGQGESLRSGEAFQVEFSSDRLERACLLHVDPMGRIRVLYPASGAAPPPSGKITLPSDREAFRLDETSGLETLILVHTDAPQLLLARAEAVMNEILSGSVVRGPGGRLAEAQIADLVSRLRLGFPVAPPRIIEHRPD